MKVIKFGGKSLKSGKGLENVVAIIKKEVKLAQIAIVVSARGNSTNMLIELIEQAKKKEDIKVAWNLFVNEQHAPELEIDLSHDLRDLKKLLKCVYHPAECSQKTRDQILAYGEIFSAKIIQAILKIQGLDFIIIDSRHIIKTELIEKNPVPNDIISKKLTNQYFKENIGHGNAIITGFIASDLHLDYTTTLGRNGSNYTAALVANYLNADIVINYSHIDRIFTADPDLVKKVILIEKLNYEEANELANFGMNVLHAKTILPLVELGIPLLLKNTLNLKSKGTLISDSQSSGVKALSVQRDMAIITLEGRGMLGTMGIDGRIFGTLKREAINVGIISQGSSERNISFIVNQDDALITKEILYKEFESDMIAKNISSIEVVSDVSVISVVGQDLNAFEQVYRNLVKNQALPLILNTTLTGKNIGLVVKNEQLQKIINIVHSQIFGINKHVHIAIFGVGTVGQTLINQIQETRGNLIKKKGVDLRIIAVANSSKLLLETETVSETWKKDLNITGIENYQISTLLNFCEKNHLENLIAIDATASKEFVKNYPILIKNGFDLVSANKIANTLSYDFYELVRDHLKEYNKTYLYETNVGAGLPLIDTLQLMHQSGEKIEKIRGVFSGSLSFIFNKFSSEDIDFHEVLQEAMEKGYTEPDPREDLSGNDVGRKLLILARELDLKVEFEEIHIQNLIPIKLRAGDKDVFIKNMPQLSKHFKELKNILSPYQVLRYVGDLDVNKKKLNVSLTTVEENSALGKVTGSDAIFEIYTESYGTKPLIIQGAGAGAKVTARGIFGDILRLTNKL